MISEIIKFAEEHWDKVIPLVTGSGGYFIGSVRTKKRLRSNADQKEISSLIQRAPSFQHLQFFFGEKDLSSTFETEILEKFHAAIGETLDDPTKTLHSAKLMKILEETHKQCSELRKLAMKDTFSVKGTNEHWCLTSAAGLSSIKYQ